jgi:hypothetical protein
MNQLMARWIRSGRSMRSMSVQQFNASQYSLARSASIDMVHTISCRRNGPFWELSMPLVRKRGEHATFSPFNQCVHSRVKMGKHSRVAFPARLPTSAAHNYLRTHRGCRVPPNAQCRARWRHAPGWCQTRRAGRRRSCRSRAPRTPRATAPAAARTPPAAARHNQRESVIRAYNLKAHRAGGYRGGRGERA